MKIVACLSWYDEPIEFLDRCVRSLAGTADMLVAYDGPWQGFPEKPVYNGGAQTMAVHEAAAAIGIGVTIVDRFMPWKSQVVKRDAMMRDASTEGDWLLVIDGDEYIADVNKPELDFLLTHTILDVATINCLRTTGDERRNVPTPIRRLFRAPVTVERGHNGYRSEDGKWLNGDSAYVRLARAADASQHLTLHHEYLNRSDERNAARAQYRSARRKQRLEVWA